MRKTTKYKLLMLPLLMSAGHSYAWAQENGAEDDSGLNVIVVTAQKREQSAQDIGLSIATISGDSLNDRGVATAEDLADVIPNVSSLNVSGSGLPIVIVRGVGLQNFRVNDSPTTAFYVDEVYQTSVISTDFTMFDLERVELLKGPQGGLYGRNTISGAMQIISKKPEPGEAANGHARAGIGRFGRAQLEAAVGIPMGDDAGMRVSGRYETSGDLQYNSITGGFEHGAVDRWAARALFRVKPADNFDLLIKAHVGQDNSESPLLRAVPTFADIGTAADANIPIPNAANVGLGALTQTLCPSLLAGNGIAADCAFVTGLTAADYGLGNAKGNRFDSVSDTRNFLDNHWYGFSVNMALELGDVTLTSISAYDLIDYRRFVDLDAVPIEYAHVDYNTDIESWSQEFRLAYDNGGPFTAVMGINYAEDEVVESSVIAGREGLLVAAFGGAINSTQLYTQETEAFAVYGHAELRASDAVNLVGELRYTNVDKSFVGTQTLGFGTFDAPFLAADDETSFENVSGKFAVEVKPSDDVLLYGSVSRGFKTGGFFGGFATNQAALAPYDEETIWAYELGFKSEVLDSTMRINGAVFYYDRSNVQQSATDVSGVVPITRLTNVGDVEAYGAELDITYSPVNELLLQLGLGYTDSSIKSSTLVSATIPGLPASSIQGTNTPNYSKFSLNFLGQYEQELSDNLVGRAQVSVSYRSKRDLNLVTNPLEAAVLTEPGYALLDLALAVGDIDDRWEIRGFVDNVTNKAYRTTLRDNGLRGLYTLFGPPRTWGVSVSGKF